MLRRLIFILAIGVLPLVDGCGPFWVDPYITVNDSALNWVNIHYYNLNRKPVRRISVYINGAGLVEVRKGSSELVSNDFARRYKEDNWNNIRSYRITIDPQHAKDIFQNLVNFGLLDREKTFKAASESSPDRFIAVKANMNTNTYSDNVNLFEKDPDLAEQLMDVVREFEHPSL